MNCHDDCRQGRNCDGQCNSEPSIKDLTLAGLLGIIMGVVFALVYIYRTGGF